MEDREPRRGEGDDPAAVDDHVTPVGSPWWRRRGPIAAAQALTLLLVLLMLAVTALAFAPRRDIAIALQPAPASDSSARAAIERWTAEDTARSDVTAACRSAFLPQPRRSERVVVLLHGFTNCPAQWSVLADALHAEGWAVVVPRLPGHGLRRDVPLAGVSAEQMARSADRAVALASGLGDRVVVAGLSAGGVLAAWTATQRPVDLVVPIAPSFAPASVPAWASGITERLARIAPNRWQWWDPQVQAGLAGPGYAYARYPTRAFGQIGRLGSIAASRAPIAPSQRVIFLLNPDDPAVNNDVATRVSAAWAAAGDDVSTEWFAASGLPHDVVDPLAPGARIDVTYPVIVDLLASELP